MSTRAAAVCLAFLLPAVATGGEDRTTGGVPPSTPDVCDLLTDAEVHAVQGQPVTNRVRQERPRGSFRVTQCVYRTTGVVSSVSLALALPATARSPASGPRQYWRERFAPADPAPTANPSRKKDPPHPVAGLGEGAFWVGDHLTGALYILQGDAFLRISVGGAKEESTRLDRTKTLAASALRRLRR